MKKDIHPEIKDCKVTCACGNTFTCKSTKEEINVEYLYAFMARTEKHAYVVRRVEDNELAETTLKNAGFHLISEADINKL